MTLTAFCDSCGKKIRVGSEYAGKKVKCLHCGHVLILPKRESFFSDPHMEFAQRSEGKGEHPEPGDEGEAEGPPAAAAETAIAVHSPDHETDVVLAEHTHTADMVRGMYFGGGFWLAASPFLLLVGLVLLALARVLLKLG